MSLKVVSDLLQEQLTDIVSLIGGPPGQPTIHSYGVAELIDSVVGTAPLASASTTIELSCALTMFHTTEHCARSRLELQEYELRSQAACAL